MAVVDSDEGPGGISIKYLIMQRKLLFYRPYFMYSYDVLLRDVF